MQNYSVLKNCFIKTFSTSSKCWPLLSPVVAAQRKLVCYKYLYTSDIKQRRNFFSTSSRLCTSNGNNYGNIISPKQDTSEDKAPELDSQRLEKASVSTNSAPAVKPITCDTPNIVFFDLETTSFERDCDITQLSAIFEDKCFSRYVLPVKPILPGAAEVTGLSVKNGKLYCNGLEVKSVGISECISDLITWLNVDVGGNAILVAHNCKTFDAPRLMYHLEQCDKVSEFSEVVAEFSDTLKAFKNVYKKEFKSYAQKNLAYELLDKEYDAHNSLNDVMILKELVEISKVSVDDILACSFPIEKSVLAPKKKQYRYKLLRLQNNRSN